MTDSQPNPDANPNHGPVADPLEGPVLVAVAPNELAAHMLQHVLDTHDIESYVFGDNTKSVLYWNAMTQVRVEVRKSDYDTARAVLEAFKERIDASIPEQQKSGHCVVCGHDRADLKADEHCPGCGSQASVHRLDEGQFQIADPPDERSVAMASFMGYAVLVVLALFLVIGAAGLFGAF